MINDTAPAHDIAMPPLPEAEAAVSDHENNENMVAEENTQQQEAQPEEKNPVEEAKERNFRALREKAQRAEKERDELLKRFEEMQKQQSAPAQQSPSPDEDDELGISDDDIAEGKHLKYVAKEIKRLKKELSQYQQRSTAQTVENRIKYEMPDFEKVVSEENVALLKTMEPELAESLAATPDMYVKAKAAYKMIKRVGIYAEDKYESERSVAKKNAAKPRPLTSVSPQQGDSPLSRANAFANGLTDELKEQLRREMNQARRGY